MTTPWVLGPALFLLLQASPAESHRTGVPNLLLGTWDQNIKVTGAWSDDDMPSTLEALQGTCQNFHAYSINDDEEWENLKELLALVAGTGMTIFAVMPSPGLDHSGCRWFDMDGDGVPGEPGIDIPPVDSCAITNDEAEWDCRQAFMTPWIEAWIRAADSLSVLSLSYPDNLKGLIINDFMTYTESVETPAALYGTKVAMSDVERIYDACHSANADFGFYPAITFGNLGSFVCPGFVLGVNYGVRVWHDESMSVLLDVVVPPSTLRSRVRFFDKVTSVDLHLFRSLWRDGVEVWSLPLDQTGRPTAEHRSVDLGLGNGPMELEFKLYTDLTSGVTLGCQSADFWNIWGVAVECSVGGGDPWIRLPFSPRFETVINSGATYPPQGTCMPPFYVELAGPSGEISNDQCRSFHGSACSPALPDDAIEGRMATRLISAPNDSFLIHDVVDGVVPYHADTDPHGPSDAMNPVLWFRELLRNAKQALGEDLLLPTQTIFDPVMVVNPVVAAHRMRIAAQEADGALAYNFPLGIYFMNPPDARGMFAEVTPTGTVHKQAWWPTHQSSLPGWYHKWVHNPRGGSVSMRVEMKDSRTAGLLGHLFKWVGGGGLADPVEIDALSDSTEVLDVPDDGTFLLSTPSDPVVIGMRAADGYHLNTSTYFWAFDDLGTAIPDSDWTFESGITESQTIDLYDTVKNFFMTYCPASLVPDPEEPPARIHRLQVIGPTPFRSTTQIRLSGPLPASARLEIFDISGRLVRRLLQGPLPEGQSEVIWNGRDDGGRSMAAGIYFLRLNLGDTSESARLVLIR